MGWDIGLKGVDKCLFMLIWYCRGMAGDQPPWQQVATEEEGGGATSSRRNMLKWECDEDLGESATISAVLYCNLRHPEFKQQYPGTTLVQLLNISSVCIWKIYTKKSCTCRYII